MGVSRKIEELLSTAKPLAPHHEAYIKAQGVLSGSNAYGVGDVDTDFDYIILNKHFNSMKLDVGDCLRYDQDELYAFEGYRSWYVKCVGGQVINLLVMEDQFYKDQFIYATEKIVEFMEASEDFAKKVTDKSFRCGAFQTLKLIYKQCYNGGRRQ